MQTKKFMAFNYQSLEVNHRKTVYQDFYRIDKVNLRHQLFAGGWSPVFEREVFCRGNAAGVVLYDPTLRQVILIEQFRIGAITHSQTPWMLEIVAGVIDSDETPEMVVHREAFEEAGVTIEQLIPINHYWVSPGGSTEQVTLFCGKINAANAGGDYGLPAENEDIRVHIISTTDAYQAVSSGLICNSLTIIGLQWLQLHETELRADWLKG